MRDRGLPPAAKAPELERDPLKFPSRLPDIPHVDTAFAAEDSPPRVGHLRHFFGTPGQMEIFVARQPILDSDQKIYGYELLFRSGPENFFPDADPDSASAQTINDSVSAFGLDSLTAGKKAFVNVARRVLIEALYSVLPKHRVVLELLETVKPDAEVMEACRELKRSGYVLALDDYVDDPDYEPLVELADFIKVDFLTTGPDERRKLAERYGSCIELLAEKIETLEDFREGERLGYKYFQGYYFCRPEMISRREIPAFKLNYLRLIQEVSRPELDFHRLEEIIKGDVSLSVRLLRLLNSAAFGYKGRVRSVRGALTLLGEQSVKKWATMLAIGGLGEDKPPELVVTCLVRARMCELLAPGTGLASHDHDLFLVGLLSLVDVLVGRPLAELVDEMALSADIRAGVLERDSRLGRVRSLVIAHERGDWEQVSSLARSLGLSEDSIPALYKGAVEWQQQVSGA